MDFNGKACGMFIELCFAFSKNMLLSRNLLTTYIFFVNMYGFNPSLEKSQYLKLLYTAIVMKQSTNNHQILQITVSPFMATED